jgi:hypothetical protein
VELDQAGIDRPLRDDGRVIGKACWDLGETRGHRRDVIAFDTHRALRMHHPKVINRDNTPDEDQAVGM